MKGKRSRKSGLLALWALPVLLTLLLAVTGEAVEQRAAASHEIVLKTEMPKIMPVLEYKIGSGKLLDRSKDKLSLMDDREIKLIGALCEKISGEKSSVSSDIAFLLVTALIVLS